MPLKTLVKVGNITNLSDARYCAGMGVEILGFDVVAGSLNYIEPQKYQEIRGWVSGPAVVAGISGLKNSSELASIVESYVPDYLELAADDFSILDEAISLQLIVTTDETNFDKLKSQPRSVIERIAYVVIQQENAKVAFLRQVAQNFKILLEPTEGSDINMTLESLPVVGLNLSGSQELKPGLKNYDHLANILELLDAD